MLLLQSRGAAVAALVVAWARGFSMVWPASVGPARFGPGRLATPLRFQVPAGASEGAPPPPKPYECFGELAAEAGTVTAVMADLPPKVNNLATKTVVAVGALASFAAMPGPAIVSAIGGVVGGALVRVAVAPSLVEGRYKSMVAKVASTLRDADAQWPSVSPEEVADIVKAWGLPEAYADAALGQVYARYLLEVTKAGGVSTKEIADLGTLRTLLSLSSEAVGAAYVDVALEVYRDVQWVFDAKESGDETAEARRVNKLLFLCDRAFGDETDEARLYEIGRVRKVLQIEDPDEAVRRVQAVATPFYERAMVGVVAKLEDVTAEMLERTRARLGVTPAVAADLAADCYSREVEKALVEVAATEDDEGDDDLPEQITEESFARLEALAAVVGLPAENATELRERVTRPIFERDAQAICEASFEAESAEGAAADIARRRTELRLDDAVADALVAQCCKAKLDEVYDAADDALLQSSSEALFFAGELARTYTVASDLLTTALVAASADFVNKTLNGHPKARGLARQLYTAFLEDTVGKGTLDADAKKELEALRTMLGISKARAEDMLAARAKPALEKYVEEPLRTGAFDRAKLDEFLASISYPEGRFEVEARKFFEAQLTKASQANPLMSDDARAYFAKLRDYLGLSEDDVAGYVEHVCAPTYKKSVLEAMAASGAGLILEEYSGGLAKLQARLGLSDAMAKRAFNDACEDRLALLVKQIDESLKVSRSPSFHSGFQAGLDTFMNDCCTLADFLTKNLDIARPADGANATGANAPWTYDVSAEGMMDEKHAEELYTEFVRRALAAADTASISRVKRYFDALPHVAGGLGIAATRAQAIKDKVVEAFYTKKRLNPKLEYESLVAKLAVAEASPTNAVPH